MKESRGIKHVIGVLGLPRSGTTLITSLLSVNSAIKAVFEPWNNDGSSAKGPSSDYFEFLEQNIDLTSSNKTALLIKETTTRRSYAGSLLKFLRELPSYVGSDVILILRNPFHVYLSEMAARRDWWGQPDVLISLETFNAWAVRATEGLIVLIEAARSHNAIVLSYEGLVTNSDLVLAHLMIGLSINLESNQLNYESFVVKDDIRGDVGLARKPKPPNTSSIVSRQNQIQEEEANLRQSGSYETIDRIRKIIDQLPADNITRSQAERGCKVFSDIESCIKKYA